MYIQNELKTIAKRLFEEKICSRPLDNNSLKMIHRYMGMSETGCDLMRRLSDIEINYEELCNVSEQYTVRIKQALICCEDLFKILIDDWNRNGLINNHLFSLPESDISIMYKIYSAMADRLSNQTELLATYSDQLAESAIQTKACSASFLEIYSETSLAYYAAALNRDSDNMLSCRSISLQARDSYNESNNIATRYLSVSKAAATAILAINSELSETVSILTSAHTIKQINVSAAVNKIIQTIEKLKNIESSLKI